MKRLALSFLFTFTVAAVAAAGAVATGCATSTSATRGSASATEYTGEPFDLRSEGNRITGQVCGMDLDLTVTPGAAPHLGGFIDARFPVDLTIRDLGAVRSIRGSFGTRPSAGRVDLRLSANRLDGIVGNRKFALGMNGDELTGSMSVYNFYQPAEARVAGRGELERLPPEVAGALLPALLSCNIQPIGTYQVSNLEVRVGGPAGALPHQSSQLYSGR